MKNFRMSLLFIILFSPVLFAGGEKEILRISGWTSLLPPLTAILLALIFRQVVLALLSGIWIGALILNNYNPLTASVRLLDRYIVGSINNHDHVMIIVFSLLLGGMVGIISRSGGAEGIVSALAKYADNRKKGQFYTALMGILIFFDDYANTLIVGNTMRPLTDKLKISREKLSYIVDSTAAPVVSLMFISTWIGYEVSLIQDSFDAMGYTGNGYIAWIQSVPYRFYTILAVVFVFLISLMSRDFGPMLTAERRVVREGKLFRDGARPLMDTDYQSSEHEDDKLRWYNALIPIITVIAVVFGGLFYTGYQASVEGGMLDDSLSLLRRLSVIVGNADSFSSLLWGSASGVLVAGILALGQKLLTLNGVIEAWLGGMRSMLIAVVILTLAWGIGNICMEMDTAGFVISLTRGILSIHFLPMIVFITAAAVAFSTGTSWGTMAILFPIVLPLAGKLSAEPGMSEANHIIFATIAAVLSGSVFGDHCSPISDTTIMSSMASGADHVDHVRTQLPYSLFVAFVAIAIGYLPAGWDFSPWFGVILGTFAMAGTLYLFGKNAENT
jgi:Na+/H+ antiporter NhaC